MKRWIVLNVVRRLRNLIQKNTALIDVGRTILKVSGARELEKLGTPITANIVEPEMVGIDSQSIQLNYEMKSVLSAIQQKIYNLHTLSPYGQVELIDIQLLSVEPTTIYLMTYSVSSGEAK